MKLITYLILTLCLLAPPSSLAGQLPPEEADAKTLAEDGLQPAADDAGSRPSAPQRPAPGTPEEGHAPAQEGGESWVRLEPGAKPAYVGIQGGTAPSSLLRATDGSLFFFTGNTGNDFTQVLGGGGNRNGTRLSAGDERALRVEKNDLQPFGLSNPEGVPFEAGEGGKSKATASAAFKPLRLGSYKNLLRYSGSL